MRLKDGNDCPQQVVFTPAFPSFIRSSFPLNLGHQDFSLGKRQTQDIAYLSSVWACERSLGEKDLYSVLRMLSVKYL